MSDQRFGRLMIVGPNKDQMDYNHDCMGQMNQEDLKKYNQLISAAWQWAKDNYTNPYIHGKATFFVASIVIPYIGEAKVLRGERLLATIEKTEPYYDDFLKLSKELEGKNVDEAIKVLKNSGIDDWITKRSDFWDDWINKCFPNKDWNNTIFETLGLDYNTFKKSAPKIEKSMQEMYNTSTDAEKYLPGIINSGSDIPIKIIAKKGANIKSPSAYYLNESEYLWIKSNPSQLESKLGLPLSSVSVEYDVYTITSKVDGNILFESTIASTKQYAKTSLLKDVYTTSGGRRQSLIINNGEVDLWEKSLKSIETIIPNTLPQK